MGKKKFSIRLTLAEFYAIRNALYEQGNNDTLLEKINGHIDMLHAYFDGRWILPFGAKPDYDWWLMNGGSKNGKNDR